MLFIFDIMLESRMASCKRENLHLQHPVWRTVCILFWKKNRDEEKEAKGKKR